MSEINNPLARINCRLDEADYRIVIWGEKVGKNTHTKQKKEKRIKKNKEGLRNLWDNMKHNNICILIIPKGEDNEQGFANVFEDIMNKSLANLIKEKDTHVQEVQSISNNVDSKRPKTRHIMIKIANLKDQERIIKARGKNVVKREFQVDCRFLIRNISGQK